MDEEEIRYLVWKAFEAGWVRRAAYTGLEYDDHPALKERFKIWSEGKQVFDPRPEDEIYVLKLTPQNIKAVAQDTDWTETELWDVLRRAQYHNGEVVIRISGLQVVPRKGL